jgi:gamma-glutamylcyclotransferase (GGCT)/AIG2-like uncharacterized protein YtfP
MRPESPNRLFVYGTLRSDPRHEMFHLLARHGQFVGEATVPGRLFDLGDYPGMISDKNHRVLGELYEIDAAHWNTVIAQLDEYEGCGAADPEPHEYRREIVDARLMAGTVLPAWAYVLSRWPASFREIESGDYLSWRAGA